MTDEDLLRVYQEAVPALTIRIEKIRLAVVAMYICAAGQFVHAWPPDIWEIILFLASTLILVFLFVRAFPIYTLGAVIEEDDKEQ